MIGKIVVALWVALLLGLWSMSFYHVALGRGRMSRGVLAGLGFVVVLIAGIFLADWTRL